MTAKSTLPRKIYFGIPIAKGELLKKPSADDITLKFSNVTTDTTDEDRDTSKVEQKGPLTFDPCPEREQDEHHVPLDSYNQAELMHWHYRLGHLSFPKLRDGVPYKTDS